MISKYLYSSSTATFFRWQPQEGQKCILFVFISVHVIMTFFRILVFTPGSALINWTFQVSSDLQKIGISLRRHSLTHIKQKRLKTSAGSKSRFFGIPSRERFLKRRFFKDYGTLGSRLAVITPQAIVLLRMVHFGGPKLRIFQLLQLSRQTFFLVLVFTCCKCGKLLPRHQLTGILNTSD